VLTTVRDCHFITWPVFADNRGALTAIGLDDAIRAFWVTGAADNAIRGNHAHRQCKHWLICLSGKVIVNANDGTNQREFILDKPNVALFIPAMIWDFETFYDNAVLLVFASRPYNENDYIRDYEEYHRLQAHYGE
jgi:UDP-2-acetamido-3-amino-2,3-dideoxy-glucuronate N-acetyltransferase